MQVRRNSKEFRKVKEILDDLDEDPAIRKKITLFVVKAGEKLHRRIPINSKLADHKILFDLQWDAVKYAMLDRSFGLRRSDKYPGLYYFRSNSDKSWDQSPFQLSRLLQKQLEAIK